MDLARDPSRAERLRRFLVAHSLPQLELEDLELALTHRSFAHEQSLSADNERLEFLGDALLTAIAAEYLYEQTPALAEGEMTRRRARLVSRETLGRYARQIGLGELILLSRGEIDTGGRERLSIAGSALEAIVGILYLRHGFDAARRYVRDEIIASLTTGADLEGDARDYKTELQEWTQRLHKQVPQYRRVSEEGPAHDRRFTVQVIVADEILGEATGTRVKGAENAAARLALDVLRSRIAGPG